MCKANANRLLRDAKLFDAKLGQIDGAGNTGPYLIQLVEAKPVAQSEPEGKKSEEKKVDGEAEKQQEKSTVAAT